jgi:hypothetical protein
MWFIELMGGVFELWCSWRLYVCLGVAMGIAATLHQAFPDQNWVWFVSMPTMITGFALGFWWQLQADRSR